MADAEEETSAADAPPLTAAAARDRVAEIMAEAQAKVAALMAAVPRSGYDLD